MEINEQLLSYVRESLAQGREHASLANELTAAGWPADQVSAVFEKLAPPKPQMPLPPMPRPEAPAFTPAAVSSVHVSEHPPVAARPLVEKKPVLADDGDEHKKVVRIIVTTGAILLGIGVYYYLAIHWQDLAEALRIAIILFSMLAAYGSGWYLKEKAGLPKIGTALMLLGTMMYGAGIFLVGRMYHITGHMADGWALWAFGSLFMGSASGLYQLKYLGIILGLVAGSLYLTALQVHATHDPARLVSALLLFALTLIQAIQAVRLRLALPDEAVKAF